jgi:O-antigen/teichoic acid export membrane protein
VLAGAGIEAVAICYLAARIVITGVLALELRRLAPWVKAASWFPHFAELRQLAGPAFASLVMTASNAVAIQGAVMAIGATVGPAAVPVFTTVRTLSRTALQFSLRLNFASMPQYTVAAERGDEQRKAQLVMANVVVAIVFLIPAAAVFLLFGIPFIHFWTAGVLNPPFVLLALMVAAMVLNGIWVPISNLIMAVNQHAGYTYFYLVVAVSSIGTAALLAPRWGVNGMAAMLVVMEFLMIVRVFILARQLRIADRAHLSSVWHKSLKQLRSLIYRTKA